MEKIMEIPIMICKLAISETVDHHFRILVPILQDISRVKRAESSSKPLNGMKSSLSVGSQNRICTALLSDSCAHFQVIGWITMIARTDRRNHEYLETQPEKFVLYGISREVAAL
jgi:hypothetical protein